MLHYIIIGLISGLLAGMIGAGGQVIMLPLLMSTGLTYNQSLAIGLAVNAVPQTGPGLYLYYKNGDFKLRESIYVIIGSTIGVLFGAYIVTKYKLSQKIMSRILSISMIILAGIIWYKFGK
jgi:uncharacterized membrane protein YfcA